MMKRLFSILITSLILLIVDINVSGTSGIVKDTNYNSSNEVHSETFKVVDWKFDELKNYLIFGLFIVVVILMKIAYHHIPRVSEYVPESCLLVIIGILFGLLIKYLLNKDSARYFKLTPELFFYILLPPIILESSYTLYHRNFLDNLLSILVFAVIGTLLNFLLIGFSLYGFAQIGIMKNLQLSLLHCLLFSSLIVAVDPVAVLAIFNEVGVNEDLYYLVFGESLLNDAVTVVLYEMIQEFSTMKSIDTKNIILGFTSFFTVSLGGMIIGVVFGILSCLIIRLMADKHTVFLEPILLIGMGYMSYLFANLFGWSGIISIIACGLMQAAYALPGISDKTNFVLKRFVKILASICEPLIFLFLGTEIVIGHHNWEISFIVCALLLCLAARFIVIFGLSGIINYIHMSIRNIPMQEKFIISYGGLRGAVAFSLAVLIKDDIFKSSAITKDTIVTTTLIIILFTIMVQGMTIKPLVQCLQISTVSKERKLGLFNELTESVMDATSKGVDGIIGKCGRYYILMVIERFSKKYLRPFLQGNNNNHGKLLEMNDRINAIILSSLSTGPSHQQLQRLPNSYKNLLTALENPQFKQNNISKLRPPLQHTMSDITGNPYTKPVKRLMPYLYRASAIVIDEDRSWNNQQISKNIIPNASMVLRAKGKFMGALQKKRESLQDEELTSMVELTPVKKDSKLVFRDVDDDDEQMKDENSKFY